MRSPPLADCGADRPQPPPGLLPRGFRPRGALVERLAGLVHALFYVLLIAIPLSGWMMSSSSNRAASYYGLFEIAPLPVPQTDDAHDALEDTHGLLAKLMLVLILLHVAGALKHHAQGHRHLTARMAPWVNRAATT